MVHAVLIIILPSLAFRACSKTTMQPLRGSNAGSNGSLLSCFFRRGQRVAGERGAGCSSVYWPFAAGGVEEAVVAARGAEVVFFAAGIACANNAWWAIVSRQRLSLYSVALFDCATCESPGDSVCFCEHGCRSRWRR